MRIPATAFTVAIVGALLYVATVSAEPADVNSGTGCFVQDATGTSFFDPACEYHYVVTYNSDGSVAFVQYQDKGQLPAGAVLPDRAVRGTVPGCCGVLSGLYDYVLSPSGQYQSKGPY